MPRCLSFGLAVALLTAHGGAEAGEALARITVDAGKSERCDTPVCIALKGLKDPWRQLRLLEVSEGKKTPVPSQLEPGDPPILWWTLSGTTAAGSQRTYELVEGEPVKAEALTASMAGGALEIERAGSRVFRYNYGFVQPPPKTPDIFTRSGYIHPVCTPSGLMVTDDFPPDHHHHKGIWMPWTKTEFEGRHTDFWNLGSGTGTVRFAGFESVRTGPVYAGFRSKHEHVALKVKGRKVALNEIWDVRVWNAGGRKAGYWLFDLTSTQRCASDSPLHLPTYRYGGIGLRGAREWGVLNCKFLTSEGKTRADGHATRAKWCDVSGKVEGEWAGVVVMGHPHNFRFPEPMRIHPMIPFFNFAPSQAGDWSIEPGKDYVFRYRFLVHDGQLKAEVAERFWADFGDPPSVSIEFP